MELGIACATYRLASFQGDHGVASRLIGEDSSGPILGNELLFETSNTKYFKDKTWGNTDHTVSAIRAALDAHQVGAPNSSAMRSIQGVSGFDYFLGYLLFDAWIANQDRHHENWGVIHGGSGLEISPTFDHAAALASLVRDDERLERLSTRDQGYSVTAFATRAKSAIYPEVPMPRGKPLGTLEAFCEASLQSPGAATFWRTQLEKVSLDKIKSDFSRCPPNIMSTVSITFALKLLEINRDRILAVN